MNCKFLTEIFFDRNTHEDRNFYNKNLKFQRTYKNNTELLQIHINVNTYEFNKSIST